MCTLPGQKSLANISWRGSAKFPKTYDLLAKIAYGKMAVYSAFVRRKTESTRSRKATPTPWLPRQLAVSSRCRSHAVFGRVAEKEGGFTGWLRQTPKQGVLPPFWTPNVATTSHMAGYAQKAEKENSCLSHGPFWWFLAARRGLQDCNTPPFISEGCCLYTMGR